MTFHHLWAIQMRLPCFLYVCGLFEIFNLCEHTHIYNFTVDMYEERLTCIT
jgi:hypothetical protein